MVTSCFLLQSVSLCSILPLQLSCSLPRSSALGFGFHAFHSCFLFSVISVSARKERLMRQTTRQAMQTTQAKQTTPTMPTMKRAKTKQQTTQTKQTAPQPTQKPVDTTQLLLASSQVPYLPCRVRKPRGDFLRVGDKFSISAKPLAALKGESKKPIPIKLEVFKSVAPNEGKTDRGRGIRALQRIQEAMVMGFFGPLSDNLATTSS